MKQVVYIHGGESFTNQALFMERLRTKPLWDLPNDGKKIKWTEHLATDLGPDYEVFLPQMPNKQNASYEEWSCWFERYFEHWRDGVSLIGCSLGAMFLAKYLIEHRLPFRCRALFLMACPLALPGFPTSDSGDFLCIPSDAAVLAERAEEVQVWHSEDDFLVPFSHGEELSRVIPGSKLVRLTDKNHFLVPELPELVEAIKSLG